MLEKSVDNVKALMKTKTYVILITCFIISKRMKECGVCAGFFFVLLFLIEINNFNFIVWNLYHVFWIIHVKIANKLLSSFWIVVELWWIQHFVSFVITIFFLNSFYLFKSLVSYGINFTTFFAFWIYYSKHFVWLPTNADIYFLCWIYSTAFVPHCMF